MQITTKLKANRTFPGCYLWCKDTNFNANHNILDNLEKFGDAVIYGAKILILMQITTLDVSAILIIALLSMVQRY